MTEQPFDADQDEPLATIREVMCRRCRKSYGQSDSRCPYCRATNPDHTQSSVPVQPASSSKNFLVMLLVAYGILLAVNVALGLVSSLADEASLLPMLILGDITMMIVVIVTGIRMWDVPVSKEAAQPILTWLLSPVLLLIAVGINFGYHHMLESQGLEMLDDELFDIIGSLWGAVLIVCVQPAIFEEIFFRHIAWKVLRRSMGTAATLLLTSVMFGLAHIGVPLSIPALMVVGVILGIARAKTGGIWLPMLIHFFHNLVVVLTAANVI